MLACAEAFWVPALLQVGFRTIIDKVSRSSGFRQRAELKLGVNPD